MTMYKLNDGKPTVILVPCTPKAVELLRELEAVVADTLCDSEHYTGFKCELGLGHDGPHIAHTIKGILGHWK
jgi:hypothetical protein